MTFKHLLNVFMFASLCFGIPYCSVLKRSSSYEKEQCYDRSDEDNLIRLILSEKKHVKGYLAAMARVGRDTIGTEISNNFSPRELIVEGYKLYFDNRIKHGPTLVIRLSDDCSSGNFEFGDNKYVVKGSLVHSNKVWFISSISMIEIN